MHTHSSKAGILGRIAAKLAGIRVIIHTVHGLPFHPYQSRTINGLYVFLERLCARISDKIIVVADAMRRTCLKNNIGYSGTFVRIFSGMEGRTFVSPDRGRREMRRILGYSDTDFVIAKVARMFPLKGHKDLVKAAETLCRSDRHTAFLFIGDGVLHKNLLKRIASLGLEDRFRFAGLVPPAEVPDYIAAADMVVHTSYREGLARIIPQALIAGKPVVSYDIDGAPEIIEDGKNGKLVVPGDITGLIGSVNDVRENYRTYCENILQNRDDLVRMFSVEKMVQDIIFCYLTFEKKWLQ